MTTETNIIIKTIDGEEIEIPQNALLSFEHTKDYLSFTLDKTCKDIAEIIKDRGESLSYDEIKIDFNQTFPFFTKNYEKKYKFKYIFTDRMLDEKYSIGFDDGTLEFIKRTENGYVCRKNGSLNSTSEFGLKELIKYLSDEDIKENRILDPNTSVVQEIIEYYPHLSKIQKDLEWVISPRIAVLISLLYSSSGINISDEILDILGISESKLIQNTIRSAKEITILGRQGDAWEITIRQNTNGEYIFYIGDEYVVKSYHIYLISDIIKANIEEKIQAYLNRYESRLKGNEGFNTISYGDITFLFKKTTEEGKRIKLHYYISSFGFLTYGCDYIESLVKNYCYLNTQIYLDSIIADMVFEHFLPNEKYTSEIIELDPEMADYKDDLLSLTTLAANLVIYALKHNDKFMAYEILYINDILPQNELSILENMDGNVRVKNEKEIYDVTDFSGLEVVMKEKHGSFFSGVKICYNLKGILDGKTVDITWYKNSSRNKNCDNRIKIHSFYKIIECPITEALKEKLISITDIYDKENLIDAKSKEIKDLKFETLSLNGAYNTYRMNKKSIMEALGKKPNEQFACEMDGKILLYTDDKVYIIKPNK